MIIQYPPYNPRIKKEKEKEFIFDVLRKQWITLTPEEWVRQNFLNYLVQEKKYPPSLIAIEKEIIVGELKKRFDILIYKFNKPWMVIECKEMNIPLSQKVLQQVLNYNIQLQAKYVVITNGIENRGFTIIQNEINPIEAIPNYG